MKSDERVIDFQKVVEVLKREKVRESIIWDIVSEVAFHGYHRATEIVLELTDSGKESEIWKGLSYVAKMRKRMGREIFDRYFMIDGEYII